MSYSVDDTQPGSPFEGDLSAMKPTLLPPDEEAPRRSGCLMNGLIVALVLIVALAIVGLSAAAGWTSGQRIANTNATATQSYNINEQLQHIASDFTDGNLAMVDIRLRWLATQTPGVPGVGDLMATATAAYENSLPTATPLVTATPEATAETTSESASAFSVTQEASGGYDLVALYDQAQNAAQTSQWQDAIDYLDVIIGVDPNFERTSVRTLMSQALNSYAQQLYNSGQPAAANLIVARARDYGALAEGLEYESMAAQLYLTARSAVGSGSPAAINAVQQLINLGPGRYYEEAQTMLYSYYVNSGDAYLAQGDSCSAVGQYQNAINLSSSGVANGKLSVAQNACANATPTPDPNVVIPSDGSVAPVGEVAPPGQ